MSVKMKKALRDILQDTVDAGVSVSFTERELKAYGVKVPEISLPPGKIRQIRRRSRFSQSVFARLLHVSPSSVRQWEQGARTPTGTTKVLLKLLAKNPELVEHLF